MSIKDLAPALPQPRPLVLSATALFLDLDGTLAPIADRPRDVGPEPRRTALLARLETRLEGRLAIISGRTLADIDRILEGRVTAVAGVHGLVRRHGEADLVQARVHPQIARAARGLGAFAARDPGLMVEDKGLSVALHFRRASHLADPARACARALATQTGLTLQEGDMVAELRTPGDGKGDSVRAFMATAPFAGATPVFVGDDATDEDGFAAAQALGGAGICVGARRPTVARFRLAGVEAAMTWLEAAR